MKKNKLTLILALILAAVAIILILSKTKTTNLKAISDFAVEDTTNVTKIFLADKQNREITLEKNAQNNWVVNKDYFASKNNVEVLLSTMLNLKVKKPVPKVAHNNVVSRMAGIAVKVEIYQMVYRINILGLKMFPHEKLTKTYYVGDSTQDNLGTYMLMENSNTPYITHIPGFRGFLYTRYSTRVKDWRDHEIFKYLISNIKSVKIEFNENSQESYIITKKQEHTFSLFSISENAEVSNYDTLKLLNFLASFRDIRFEALLNDMRKEKKDSIISSSPFQIITVIDTANNVNAVKTFHLNAAEGELDVNGDTILYDRDRLHALINNDKDFTLIQFYVFDKITRPLSYFTNDTILKPVTNFSEIK